MTKWIEEPVVPTCPTCGADTTRWRATFIDLDWRDDAECEDGYLAHALIAHRYAEHPVTVAVGDLVRYWSPWRGLVLGSEVYRVDSIRPDADFHDFARSMGAEVEPLIGTNYTLTNPGRRDDHCFPFVGDPARPIVFELVAEAPPVEVDLMDLLGWEEYA